MAITCDQINLLLRGAVVGAYATAPIIPLTTGNVLDLGAGDKIDPAKFTDGMTLRLAPGATYAANDLSITAKNVSIIASASLGPAGPKPVLMFNGPGKDHAIIHAYGRNPTIDGIAFECDTKDDTQRANAVAVHADGGTVKNCTFNAVNSGLLWNNKNVAWAMNSCDCRDLDSIAEYLAWIEGINGRFADNKCFNSIYQHIFRASIEASDIKFHRNVLSNLDRRRLPGGNPVDTAKGCFTIQRVDGVELVENVVLGGGVRLGPLNNVVNGAMEAGEKAEDRCKNVTVKNNKFFDVNFEIAHGAENIVVDGNLFVTTAQDRCISVDGYSDLFQRGVNGLTVSRNMGVMYGGGYFLRAWGAMTSGVLDGNIGTGVCIDGPNVSNWKSMNNKWNLGVNTINGAATTPAQWAALMGPTDNFS